MSISGGATTCLLALATWALSSTEGMEAWEYSQGRACPLWKILLSARIYSTIQKECKNRGIGLEDLIPVTAEPHVPRS